MKKRIKRIISTILCIVMIFSILPIMSYAQESKKEVVEITEKRDQNSKTYLNEDGTYTTIMTAEALHYQDENGVWQEIDNRLESVGGVLQNKANGFTAKLPETMSEGGEVEISKEGTSLKLIAIGVSRNSLGNVKNNKEVSAKKQKIDYTNTWKLSSEAYYPEVYEGADVQYIVQATGIKENIIIKSAPEKKLKYKYEIIAEGVEGEKKEDGSIEFYKDGELEYVIPAPYMYDSSGSPEGYSVDIEVEFKATGKGKYMLTYTPSKEWLADSARVYPVTLDPTVSSGTDMVEDAHISSTVPTSNHGNAYSLFAHTYTYNGNTYNYEAYIKFDESVFENKVEITSATLNMKYSTVTPVTYSLYEVTSDWSESTLTWDTKPTYKSTSLTTASASNQNWVTFNVTNSLKKYGERNGNIDFYGFRIKGSDVSAYPPSLYLYSSENTTSSTYVPYLSITYKINRVQQATTRWCWAACMQMLLEYEGIPVVGSTDRAKQETIYRYVFPTGTISDTQTAYTEDIVDGLKSILPATEFSDASAVSITDNTTNAVNTIKSMISAGKIVLIFAELAPGDNIIGHFLIVYKVDQDNNYYMIDPFRNNYNGIIVASQSDFLSNNFKSNAIGYCHAVEFISY